MKTTISDHLLNDPAVARSYGAASPAVQRAASFTPGPWGVFADVSIAPLEGNVFRGPTVAKVNDDLEEARANAKLIAAAPELLGVLQECLEVFELPEPTPDAFGTCYTASQRSATIAKAKLKARAAIAKAL